MPLDGFSWCDPLLGVELPGTPMDATRDAYNVYDLDKKIIYGNQDGERALNCVSGASN